MSVSSRKRWTLSVPRTRLSVSDDRSVKRPSATLLLARLRSKCFDIFSFVDGFWRCGCLNWGIDQPMRYHSRSTTSLVFTPQVWLGGFDSLGIPWDWIREQGKGPLSLLLSFSGERWIRGMREAVMEMRKKERKNMNKDFLTKSMAWRFVCDMTNLDLIAFYCLLLPANPRRFKI